MSQPTKENINLANYYYKVFRMDGYSKKESYQKASIMTNDKISRARARAKKYNR